MKTKDLRAVIVVSAESGHTWYKFGYNDNQVEPVTSPTLAVSWLEAHGYRQAGALVGPRRDVAVCWLKESDQPEYLAPTALGDIRPATCFWNAVEGKIQTTRSAGQIQRDRRRQGRTMQDLAYVERPTWAAMMRCYGLTTDKSPIMDKGC
jgi:hypothetical protein